MDAAPPTKRFGAFDLAYALAAMESATDRVAYDEEEENDEKPPTLRVGAEASRELVAKAFRLDAEQRSDDEPTLDVAAAAIPHGLRSPICDDDLSMRVADDPTSQMPFETLTIRDLGLDLDDELPLWAEVAPTWHEREPSGMRVHVSARSEPPPPISAASTPCRAAELHDRRLVVASWTMAIAMGGFCTYMLATTESSVPYPPSYDAAAPRVSSAAPAP